MADSQNTTIGPLKDIDGVRRELARVYRSARRGTLTTERARALAALLGDIRQCLTVDDAPGWRTPIETKQ